MVTVGTSVFVPTNVHYDYVSGLSLFYVFPESETIGVAFNPTKIKCAQCNTPVAEVVAGSMIIRNKHHGTRHTTVFTKNDLKNLL
jgi:hypothetical protein